MENVVIVIFANDTAMAAFTGPEADRAPDFLKELNEQEKKNTSSRRMIYYHAQVVPLNPKEVKPYGS